MNGKEFIRLKLKSYDVGLLELSITQILETVKSLNVLFAGPILLPTKKEKFTVKKSTHVYKEANEHYELCTHQRIIDIYSKSPSVIQALSKLTLYSGIDISFKTLIFAK